jgi:hypothetical protein
MELFAEKCSNGGSFVSTWWWPTMPGAGSSKKHNPLKHVVPEMVKMRDVGLCV